MRPISRSILDWFSNRDENGQGLAEYALILALISVVTIADPYTILGWKELE